MAKKHGDPCNTGACRQPAVVEVRTGDRVDYWCEACADMYMRSTAHLLSSPEDARKVREILGDVSEDD